MEKSINICPHCHIGIDPTLLESVNINDNVYAEIYSCPVCHDFFFAETIHVNDLNISDVYTLEIYPPNPFDKRDFSELISNLSPRFVTVYNQAWHADFDGLDEICGIGYRKALEILIKDFAAYLTPEKAEEIRQDTRLSNVINNRIPNETYFEEIKEFANRSWWLGSDETHYHHKYNDDELADLKTCVDLVVNEIDFFLKKKQLKGKIIKK